MWARLILVAVVLFGLGLWLTRRPPPAPRESRPATEAAAGRRADREPIRLSGGEATPAADAAARFTLEGRVLSTVDAAPVAGALVVLGLGEGVSETRADGDGHFRFTTSSAGTYELTSLEAPGYVSFAPGLGQSSIVFQARLGVRLRDVTLYLTPEPARAADAGRLAPADAGAAMGAGQVEARGDAATGPRGRIVGTVREADTGRPIAAFSIVAQVKRGGVERGSERHGSYFDSEGRFVLADLLPGTQCVTALALGRAASAEQCVDVPAEGEAHVDLAQGRGARLSGRVFDRTTRAPIAHAHVALEQPFSAGEASPLPVIASTDTSADGTFELTGLDTGVRSLFVTAASHHSRVLPGLRLDADRPPPPLDIDLLATEPGEEPHIESAGINAAVRADGDNLVIQGLSPEGGAAQAGLAAGDVILRVDGVPLSTLGMQAGVERLRGQEGSTVVLSVRRPPDTTVRDVPVVRRRVVNRF